MRKLLLFLVLAWLAVACSPAGGNESATTPGTNATGGAPEAPAFTFVPATNVAEAAIVREQDWTLGAAEPKITIIEYGDYQ